jgi:hypothetical protein
VWRILNRIYRKLKANGLMLQMHRELGRTSNAKVVRYVEEDE